MIQAFLLAGVLAVAPPQRIISLSPSVTEILDGVGAFDRVVAVSSFCDYPPEVKALPRVGGWTDTNLEQVLSLHPDLVILIDAQQPLVENRLQALGLRTLVVGSQTLPDIFQAVSAIGKAVGNEAEAARLAESMRAELDAIAAKTAGRPRPTVLVVVDRLPGTLRDVYVATRDSYLTTLVELAGGKPIKLDAAHNYTQISAEALVASDPEVVFDVVQALNAPVAVPGAPGLQEDPSVVWRTIDISAVRNHRVYPLSDKRFVHPSPFAVRAAREFAERLHPGAFAPERQ
jgi:iron complex transport system substrate-binding protein